MFKQKQLIKFSDCDPAGILFYGKVFYLAHNIYEEFLYENNLYDSVFNNPELAFPIIKTSAEYSKPIKYGDQIIIELKIKNVGESSFSTVYLLKKDEQILASVEIVHVCVSKRDFNKLKLPESLRKIFTSAWRE